MKGTNSQPRQVGTTGTGKKSQRPIRMNNKIRWVSMCNSIKSS